MAANRLSDEDIADLRAAVDLRCAPANWSDPDYETDQQLLAALDELIDHRRNEAARNTPEAIKARSELGWSLHPG
jgi:hypothetical protein